MNAGTLTRRRSTEVMRQAHRMTQVTAIHLGQAVRAGRAQLRLTQEALAARVGVRQTWISRIELGHGQGVPLELWVALGVALGRPLAITLSRPLGEPREPADAGHLAMQERLLELAHASGHSATFELPTRPLNPRHSIDVCVRNGRDRILLIQEAWNSFGDVGAAIRSTNRKAAEAADLAVTIDDGPPYRVAIVWIVRPSATNRRLVARYPEVFRSAFPASSRAWVAALTSGAPTPLQAGLVWLDPVGGRLTGWNRRPVPKRIRPTSSRATSSRG
jgi:transcriptional regulator with XRE-family HTH domain